MTQSIVGEKSLAFAKRIANFPSKREQRKLAFYAEREESQRS